MLNYPGRQFHYLLEITRALGSSLDLKEVLQRILETAAEILHGQVGILALRNRTGQLQVVAAYGFPQTLLPRFQPLLEDIPYDRTETGFRISREDVLERLRLVSEATHLNLRQVVAIPLALEDEFLGIIYIFRTSDRPFTVEEEYILRTFADHAAIAVRNARLYTELQLERNRLRTIIENSADGIMILDAECRVEVINRALSRMTGWPPERARGQMGGTVLHLENATGPDPCEKLRRGEVIREQIYREGDIIRPGHPRITVGVTYTPVFDDEGELQYIIVNVNDITRFREAEEMKSTFISVISHELKTPVALIKGYAATLRREDVQWDEETIREGLAIIEEEADRLTQLIDNLLDASRIQAGGLKLEMDEVNLKDLIERVVKGFRMQTAAHEIITDVPEDLPPVWGDRERIRQILSNLLSNAIKYSPRGGVIRVGAWAEGDYVTVYVADQGIGIPEEEQANLFDKFYRVDSSLRRRTQGAGLGLYLAKALVEAHGGRIWVHSKPGAGATFFFTLPIARSASETDEAD
ncbi:MAG: GAF domain-containing protein [Chloroflexi bacterium]|nr:GAF domain-containing protein [Chloroflexota bacterium]